MVFLISEDGIIIYGMNEYTATNQRADNCMEEAKFV